MTQKLSRRHFLKKVAIGGIAVGFNLQNKSWATTQDLENYSSNTFAEDFPDFEGELITDITQLTQEADDFGHIHQYISQAILKPATYQDIIKMVKFANNYDLKIAVKGQGFSTNGETQTQAGVVIDMASLSEVFEINDAQVSAQAGARWIDVLEQTVPQNLGLPIVTDFLELSIGGSIAVGGFGAQSYKHGCMADNIVQLKVITGDGCLVACSLHQNPLLFHSMKAGLGQFGIIVESSMKLETAPTQVRAYQLIYNDLESFLNDSKRLLDESVLDGVQGGAEPSPEGGWRYILQLAKYFESDAPPIDSELLNGLNFNSGGDTAQDMPYFTFLNRLTPVIEQLKAAGLWSLPHPWCPLFIPASKAKIFIEETLANTNPNDVAGPILMSMQKRSAFKSMFLSLPDEENFVYFSLMRTAIPPTPERIEELTASNRTVYENARDIGGYQYPVGAIPMDRTDWKKHYHNKWFLMKILKSWFDPKHVLGPMRGIFNR
ncbi:FAD-binding protein [Pseudoalteromonas denitrificans]|uniref:Tat (Twin-arginine translocation) pathway signal sequence n=1 Tax=Pseudoalteromonas denitrificans DSM 6059 TaxID=1123010 RepID=A0A1I1G1T1_9GAMM|nr:FAD-binding protein [Pseudoalteromonas denitrificans]SFC05242.1 Tat (twin-arginine translocation) pathway signal sequence [Pseudoalteromonas denitrificans DSM 6059]